MTNEIQSVSEASTLAYSDVLWYLKLPVMMDGVTDPSSCYPGQAGGWYECPSSAIGHSFLYMLHNWQAWEVMLHNGHVVITPPFYSMT